MALIMLLVAGAAMAHPHGWVDYRVAVVFDDSSRVVAFKQYWLLDPFQSLTLTEGLGSVEGTTLQQGLDAVGQEIAANLNTNGNLTHLFSGERELKVGDIEHYTTRLDNDRVEFAFELPLDEPLPPTEPLRWQIYDPTYYIEFLHSDRSDTPVVLENAPAGCKSEIIAADPDPAKVAAAAALDADEQPEDEKIGRFFAETGVMTCPAP
ncbi:DUF1007 family protein [Kushneria aurantia]|uniref:DUF1007 family protein n=1 Tax=Kushneria aurantia TaxID=504092 RepID=A0ABV6FZ43_9GAMM|nr:DUF1007 family protein [Kushneria aurantia]